MGEFHTELELIPLSDQQNRYVAFSVHLEKWLMEGTYNKVASPIRVTLTKISQVISASKDVPLPSYSFFMGRLTETVRNKIADCSEKAYKNLPLNQAPLLPMLDCSLFLQVPSLLMLSTQADVSEFIKTNSRPWTCQGCRFINIVKIRTVH